MAKCGICGKNTVNGIRTNDPTVVAKCRNCGHTVYRKIKMTEKEYSGIIKMLIDDYHLSFEYVAQRTGEPISRLKEYYSKIEIPTDKD